MKTLIRTHRQIVQHDTDSGKHPLAMTTLLERQLNECGTLPPAICSCIPADSSDCTPDNVLRNLQDSLSVLSPELMPIHERLINIRRQLVALLAKETESQAAMAAHNADDSQSSTPLVRSRSGTQSRPPEEEPTAAIADRALEREVDMESKTPTKDVPNPEPVQVPKLKAELKPLLEELRKIDSLSVLAHLVVRSCSPW